MSPFRSSDRMPIEMSQFEAGHSSRLGRVRAPREHGQVLAIPPLTQAAELADRNAATLALVEREISGRSFPEFRRWTRQSILQASRHWMKTHLGVTSPGTDSVDVIYATGHQPEFVHPGVWAKNIAVAALGRQSQAIGFNLIVDNDTVEHCEIGVPVGTTVRPEIERILFNRPCSQRPWEGLSVQNLQAFRQFSNSVVTAAESWRWKPVISDIWREAVDRAEAGEEMAVCLTAARVALERQFGLTNLELPVSRLCELEPFALFVYEVCARHREFVETYNEAVHEYRQRHHIRNRRHPVPDLEQREDTFELPFWYWTHQQTERSRVFVKVRGRESVLLADGNELCRFHSPDSAVAAISVLHSQGKLRTRALTTTLFMRLFFADLFVHGIGGAKYDEITNALIERFFQVPAPAYLTLTATWHLPIAKPAQRLPSVTELEHRLRDLEFNPERYVTSPEMGRLAEQKHGLLEERRRLRECGLSKRERRLRRPLTRQRHLKLRNIEQQMRDLVRSEVELTQQQLTCARADADSSLVLNSREYPVLLFPRDSLQELVAQLQR